MRPSNSPECEYLYLTSSDIQPDQMAFLPIGSIEAHGSSLPLGTDSLVAEAFALAFARKVAGVALPAITYGFCPNTAPLRGTVSPDARPFMEYMRAVCLALCPDTFQRLVVVSIHNGNDAPIKAVVDDIFQTAALTLYYVNAYTFLDNDIDRSLFRDKDNSYKEACLLHASLEVLNRSEAVRYNSWEDKPLVRRSEVQTLRRYGHLGFVYPEEDAHIAPRKDVDTALGIRYFELAQEKMMELSDTWKKLDGTVGGGQ